jgi:enoyl-CoA hydratase/carnithine racemase
VARAEQRGEQKEEVRVSDHAVVRERRGSVEILTINRPDQRNAINGAVSRGIASALDELATDDEVAVVILTGAGDRAFCAGMDLKAFAAGEMPETSSISGGFAGITRRSFGKPLIAAVNGVAVAGGFEIVLSCDLAVAADHATFGIPEVTRGLLAAAGGLVRLPKRLPLAVALELALTGLPIDAERARALGLVNRVVPRDQTLDAALELAEVIAANAPLAVRASKAVLRAAADTDEASGWRINDDAAAVVSRSTDAREGALAFAEKRPPVWTGRHP